MSDNTNGKQCQKKLDHKWVFVETDHEVFIETLGIKTRMARACVWGDIRTIIELLKKGADVNEPVDGRPPIFWAVACGCAKTVNLLIESGASIKMPGDEWDLLHLAVNGGMLFFNHDLNLDIIKLLIDAGAYTECTKGKYPGSTPLEAALLERKFVIAQFLLNCISRKAVNHD